MDQFVLKPVTAYADTQAAARYVALVCEGREGIVSLLVPRYGPGRQETINCLEKAIQKLKAQ